MYDTDTSSKSDKLPTGSYDGEQFSIGGVRGKGRLRIVFSLRRKHEYSDDGAEGAERVKTLFKQRYIAKRERMLSSAGNTYFFMHLQLACHQT